MKTQPTGGRRYRQWNGSGVGCAVQTGEADKSGSAKFNAESGASGVR